MNGENVHDQLDRAWDEIHGLRDRVAYLEATLREMRRRVRLDPTIGSDASIFLRELADRALGDLP